LTSPSICFLGKSIAFFDIAFFDIAFFGIAFFGIAFFGIAFFGMLFPKKHIDDRMEMLLLSH
jgi:hypothetical protein